MKVAALVVGLGVFAAAADEAKAGTATCDGNWSTSGYWGSGAYATVDATLLYFLEGTSYMPWASSADTQLLAAGGPLHFEGNWGLPYLEGTFRVRWQVTIYNGLTHQPTPQELLNWPAANTQRLTLLSSQFSCLPPVCGNGRLEALEECDDGNFSPGDGCSAYCTIEPYVFSSPGIHTFTVPTGCTGVDMKLWGAGGGGYPDYYSYAWGGGGGFTNVTASVSPGDTLLIAVGQGGSFRGSWSSGGGASTIIDGMNYSVLAQAGGGGGGGTYQGAGGGAGGGDISGGGGGGGALAGGGADNTANGGAGQGGLSWNGMTGSAYTLFDYVASGTAGDGHWEGGEGFPAMFHYPQGPGGGGTGWTHGPGVTSNGPGQGTFAGWANEPAGRNDDDYDGYAGYGSVETGVGSNGRVVLRCRH